MESNNLEIEKQLKEKKIELKNKLKLQAKEINLEIKEINKQLAEVSKMKTYQYTKGYYNDRYNNDEEYKEKRKLRSLQYYYDRKKKLEEAGQTIQEP
jgi:hypothetical protein